MTKPANSRQAIIMFHFADRLKAELLIASRLLGAVLPLQGEERTGGGRVLLEYLKGLEQEINLSAAQIDDPEMIRVRTVMSGLIGMSDSGMYQDMQEHLTWILTIVTTYAQRGLEMLIQEKLM